jgi:hypothetical protein
VNLFSPSIRSHFLSSSLPVRVKLDVRGYVHHSTVHKENPSSCNNVSEFFIIPYLYESQHVLGDTLPITKNLKLHWQPLVFHTWKVVRRVVGGRCKAHTVPDNVHQLHFQRPFTYEKPEAAVQF